eukprot:4134370-Pleurochrysis_carterae.AAC.1
MEKEETSEAKPESAARRVSPDEEPVLSHEPNRQIAQPLIHQSALAAGAHNHLAPGADECLGNLTEATHSLIGKQGNFWAGTAGTSRPETREGCARTLRLLEAVERLAPTEGGDLHRQPQPVRLHVLSAMSRKRQTMRKSAA